MALPRKSLAKPRSLAFSRQGGICCYCGQPMWLKDPSEFASKHNITPKQAKHLQCTGEHLKAHKDGGTAEQNNIAAACLFCNRKRHQRKTPPSPGDYKKLIDRRMSEGRWHIVRLIDAGCSH